MKNFLTKLFLRCGHRATTWPRTDQETREVYVVCLDCGRRLEYSAIEFRRAS